MTERNPRETFEAEDDFLVGAEAPGVVLATGVATGVATGTAMGAATGTATGARTGHVILASYWEKEQQSPGLHTSVVGLVFDPQSLKVL